MTTPLRETWNRFSVVSPHGIELKAFGRLEETEEFAAECAETGLWMRPQRRFPPRRFSPPGRWMVGEEQWASGGGSYTVVSPDGVVMEEYGDKYEAALYVQQQNMAEGR